MTVDADPIWKHSNSPPHNLNPTRVFSIPVNNYSAADRSSTMEKGVGHYHDHYSSRSLSARIAVVSRCQGPTSAQSTYQFHFLNYTFTHSLTKDYRPLFISSRCFLIIIYSRLVVVYSGQICFRSKSSLLRSDLVPFFYLRSLASGTQFRTVRL